VYIMGNDRPTLYIGVTTDLARRAYEHKQFVLKGFASKYKLNKLLYFETFPDLESSIKREKQLKGWKREWKLNLIKTLNPNFDDLDQNSRS